MDRLCTDRPGSATPVRTGDRCAGSPAGLPSARQHVATRPSDQLTSALLTLSSPCLDVASRAWYVCRIDTGIDGSSTSICAIFRERETYAIKAGSSQSPQPHPTHLPPS